MNNLNHTRSLAARLFAAGLLLASAGTALAAVRRYVDVNSTNSMWPYISWATAASGIQEAIEVAVAGDEIVVTNGTYSVGGRSTFSQPTTTNRVSVDKPLVLRSVNGPQFTTIDGRGVFRCVYLTNGASLAGFTLTNGSAVHGAGLWCESTNAVASNCVVSGNSAPFRSYDVDEPGPLGGGAYGGTLNNCTLTDNSADDGGGADQSRLNNCIVYFNIAPQRANYANVVLNYSCTTPQPTSGVGNITNEPAFVNFAAGNYRLHPDSPCIDAGTNLSASITNDLDGRPRPLDGNGDGLAAFDMGAYEYRTPLLVWQDSPNPTAPHADWASAAHTIQEAVDVSVAGDEIMVTNGIYATGARAVYGHFNRVIIDKPLTVRSVNGPGFTIIHGADEFPGIRCAYLTNNVTLTGFTLTGGAAYVGGGVFCDSQTAVISNCMLTGNSARYGGGVMTGTLNNCILAGNFVDYGYGGGASGCKLNNCTLISNLAYDDVGAHGGGAYACVLNNCTLSGNRAGAYVSGFGFKGKGGGASYSTLNNCTLSGNSAASFCCSDGGDGGGASFSTLNNCIVHFNNGSSANYHASTLNYSCTTPQPTNGVGNITNAPLFVDQASGNLRLQSNSPCINAGRNALAPAGPDLDGNQRIVGGVVDIGAYEFQSPTSIISYAWLQQYALPTDGSADSADLDGDHLNNWQEWRCATGPTNALSALRLLAPTVVGPDLILRWESVGDRTYFLDRSPAASSAFTPLATGIPGLPGTTTYTDTNSFVAGLWFYRVGVSTP